MSWYAGHPCIAKKLPQPESCRTRFAGSGVAEVVWPGGHRAGTRGHCGHVRSAGRCADACVCVCGVCRVPAFSQAVKKGEKRRTFGVCRSTERKLGRGGVTGFESVARVSRGGVLWDGYAVGWELERCGKTFAELKGERCGDWAGGRWSDLICGRRVCAGDFPGTSVSTERVLELTLKVIVREEA